MLSFCTVLDFRKVIYFQCIIYPYFSPSQLFLKISPPPPLLSPSSSFSFPLFLTLFSSHEVWLCFTWLLMTHGFLWSNSFFFIHVMFSHCVI